MKFQPSVVDDVFKVLPKYWLLKSLGSGEIEFEVKQTKLIIIVFVSANWIVFVCWVERKLFPVLSRTRTYDDDVCDNKNSLLWLHQGFHFL